MSAEQALSMHVCECVRAWEAVGKYTAVDTGFELSNYRNYHFLWLFIALMTFLVM
jgi:hypothetical protein